MARATAAETDPRLSTRGAADPAHLLPEHASEPGGHRPGSRGRLVVVAIVILLLSGFVIWRIHANNQAAAQQAAKQAAAANRPTPVQTAPVQKETVPVFLTALGTVTAYNTVTLQPRVSGQLLEVNFQEGQAVSKGQLLLQIDPRPYQAALDQAVGTVAKDEANLKDMQAEAERYTALYEAGVVSKEQQQLEVNNQGQAVGSIKSDEAAVEAARVNLGYTKIYSPIDGIVGLRQVDPGNVVNAGTTSTTGLVVITQIHPIGIIFTLPEDQLPQVQQAMRRGKKLVVEAYDRTDAHKIASGTLLTIDNQIDTTTGTAKLKAVFENRDSALFANQFVNIRLILSERPNAIVVPTAAIETGNQGDYVFLVNPGPTPADKLQNLPGYTPANATGATTAAPKKASAASGDDEEGDESGGKSGKPRQPFHADAVNVKVDFTIGTNSVLSTGTTLQPGQPVVVDGQEKLVDGGNVMPSQARVIPAANSGGTVGATNPNAATTPTAAGSGGLSPASPVPADSSTFPGSGHSAQDSNQNSSQTGKRRRSPSAPSGGGTNE